LEHIVRKAIKGNDEAFLEIIRSCKADLYKTALAYLRNEEEALEAVQEVTFRAYRSIKDLKQPAYFKTWIIRIMIHYCCDRLKKQNRLVYNEQLLLAAGGEENTLLFEIQDAMETLDDRSRELLTLKYFHDLKIREVAALYNRPEGTVKTWLNKALKSLREKLEESGGKMDV
jgi:RNA polymerase sigma-70 factor (TIGR02954 family)